MNADRIFFITSVTIQRLPIFRHETNAKLLIDTLTHYRDQRKFLLHEFVIMPDHIHLLLTPSPDIALERAVQFIKGGFSYRMKTRGTIWQSSFTNHRVRDLGDYGRHREYIHLNPVRAHLVERARDYPYSSAFGAIRLDPVPQGLKPCSLTRALTRA